MMETEVVVDADCESDLLCLVGVPLTDGMREDAGVSDEAKEYVHDVFALMTAGNGMMNVRNIPNVMEAIELGLSREEKRRVAMRFGHRKQIGIDDLMFVVDQKLLAESQRRVMSKVYECMAANTDVGISEGDLSRINADFERELTDDQITGMIQSTGRKRQGHVTFSEFMHALVTLLYISKLRKYCIRSTRQLRISPTLLDKFAWNHRNQRPRLCSRRLELLFSR